MAQVEYDVERMLARLIKEDIPNTWERNFVAQLWHDEPKRFTVAQYNKILDLFNKYICLQCKVPITKADGTNRGPL